jgi:hypothetical protein
MLQGPLVTLAWPVKPNCASERCATGGPHRISTMTPMTIRASRQMLRI